MPLADHPHLLPGNWQRSLRARVPRKMARDLWNRLRYGPGAPLSDEPIYVAPANIAYLFDREAYGRPLRRDQSGTVLGGDWDLCRLPLADHVKLQSCRMHWRDGVPWPETPLYQKLLAEIAAGHRPDGCADRAALDQRYAALDRIYEQTRARGRLLAQGELPERFRREQGGILVHVGRDGTLLRASGGMHRFAIARVLELPEMPAQLGVIHPQALAEGLLPDLRRSALTARD